jgi:hypothetical protein
MAVKQNFGIDVDILANFAPNNWKKEPTYTLKKWETNQHDYDLFNAYLELARLRGLFRPRGLKFIANNFESSAGFSLISYEDYVKGIIEKENERDEIQLPIEGEQTTINLE